MFEAKSAEKLHSTAPELYRNKIKLDEFMSVDPFEMGDLNGLKILKHTQFEPYYKIIQSLEVTDDDGNFLPKQTESLKKDITQTAKKETFLELLYLPDTPEQKKYNDLLEEKLFINLVNLVLNKELPTDRSLTESEIATAQKAFRKMLKGA